MADGTGSFVTQETVLEAVRNPGELGDVVLRVAVQHFEELSPAAQEMYLEELRRKSLVTA